MPVRYPYYSVLNIQTTVSCLVESSAQHRRMWLSIIAMKNKDAQSQNLRQAGPLPQCSSLRIQRAITRIILYIDRTHSAQFLEVFGHSRKRTELHLF